MKRATTVTVSLLGDALVSLLVTVAFTVPLLVGGLTGAFTYIPTGGLAAATFTGVPVGVVGALVAGYPATRRGRVSNRELTARRQLCRRHVPVVEDTDTRRDRADQQCTRPGEIHQREGRNCVERLI
jgi:hypothetical protein